MSWPSDHFTAASWIGDDFVDGELSPEDIVIHRVVELLEADTKIQDIFGPARVEALQVPRSLEWRNLPRLVVYPGSTEEDQVPTQTSEDQVSIVVGVVRSAVTEEVVEHLSASMSSLLWHIKGILRVNRNLVTTVNGTQVQLARNSGPGPIRHAIFPQDLSQSGRFGLISEVPWTYEVHTNTNTGRIRTVEDAS